MDVFWQFTEPFTEHAQELYMLLYTKHFDKDALISKLKSGVFNVDDINAAAFQYVDDCSEAEFQVRQKGVFANAMPGELIPNVESSHLLETIEILLDYGLDPNKIYFFNDGGQANIMKEMMFVHNGYLAADAAAAMLSRGGNPSIILDGDSLIRDLNMEQWFFIVNNDMFLPYEIDAVVHYWMVFIGYGAKLEDGGECVDSVGNFDIAAFRNHRQYYYGMIQSDHPDGGAEICYFDKDTYREVARY